MLASGLADLLLPGVCQACRADDASVSGLCSQCSVKLLSLVAQPYCIRCGTSLGPGIAPRPDGCFACPTTLPRFARLYRLGAYAPPLSEAIRQFKYHRQQALCRHLVRLLAQGIEAEDDGGEELDLALPIPPHWRRRIARAFDHSRTLAEALASELELPCGGELLRVRNTPPQAHLPRTRRIENMRGAYQAESASTLQGARVLLVDDVTTTGATANEAARTLLAAGASKVVLAVLAKSDPPRAYAHSKE